MRDPSKRDNKQASFAIRTTVVFVELVAAGMGMLLALGALGLVGSLFSLKFDGEEMFVAVASPFVALLAFMVLLAMFLACHWFTRHLSITYGVVDSKRLPSWFVAPGRHFANVSLQVVVGFAVLALFVGGVATFRDGFGSIPMMWFCLWGAMLFSAALVLKRFKGLHPAPPYSVGRE